MSNISPPEAILFTFGYAPQVWPIHRTHKQWYATIVCSSLTFVQRLGLLQVLAEYHK